MNIQHKQTDWCGIETNIYMHALDWRWCECASELYRWRSFSRASNSKGISSPGSTSLHWLTLWVSSVPGPWTSEMESALLLWDSATLWGRYECLYLETFLGQSVTMLKLELMVYICLKLTIINNHLQFVVCVIRLSLCYHYGYTDYTSLHSRVRLRYSFLIEPIVRADSCESWTTLL